jgi:hypothetical protein
MRMKNDRVITEMKAYNSTRICRTSDSIINKAVHPYHKELYNKKNTFDSCEETCLDSYSRIVPKELRDKLTINFRQKEVADAIDNLTNSKAPGADGLSIIFNKKFKHITAPELTEMYYIALKQKRLPISTRNSIISILHKKKR